MPTFDRLVRSQSWRRLRQRAENKDDDNPGETQDVANVFRTRASDRPTNLGSTLLAADEASRGRIMGQLQKQLGNNVVQRLIEDFTVGDAPKQLAVSRQAQPAARPHPQTEAQARALVPSHVSPKHCFIWFVNSQVGWAPIDGTGCAHWVAHEMRIRGGTVQCQQGHPVRVSDVVSGRASIADPQVQAGDIWQNPTTLHHVGIVRGVDRNPDAGTTRFEVEHDSSGAGAVITSWFLTGNFYR